VDLALAGVIDPKSRCLEAQVVVHSGLEALCARLDGSSDSELLSSWESTKLPEAGCVGSLKAVFCSTALSSYQPLSKITQYNC